LNWRKLRNLEQALRQAREVSGDYLEAGVALGGSAVVIGSQMPTDRTLHLYDTFAMIPAASDRDPPEAQERFDTIRSGASGGIGGNPYYGYLDNLDQRVCRTLEEYGLRGRFVLHKGLFETTLTPDGPVALAHLDSDWYESVRVCLDRIYPHLARGGLLVSDDYSDWGGAREALDEFWSEHGDIVRVAGGEQGTNLVLRRGT